MPKETRIRTDDLQPGLVRAWKRHTEKLGMNVLMERVPSNSKLAGHLQRWRQMNHDGWDVTVLLSPDKKTVVAFGYENAQPGQLHLFAEGTG
jgi:hypothetical protein